MKKLAFSTSSLNPKHGDHSQALLSHESHSGTGVSPVRFEFGSHGRDARATTAALAAVLLAACAAEAQDWPDRMGLSYRAGFNITAKISNVGYSGASFSGVPSPNPGPATGGVDHNYDDGYNRVKDEGNVAGLTWNWGYASASQIVGDNVLMSRSLSGNLTGDFRSDPQNGAEVNYLHQFGRVGRGTWGIEIAVNYMYLSLKNTSSLDPSVLALDAYSLGGLLAPTAGFMGTAAGPGPLISDAPARADTLSSRLTGNAWGGRLGPYLEFPLAKKVSVNFGGGFALLYLDSEFKYEETALIAGVSTEFGGASGSHHEILLGGYVTANLNVVLSSSVNVFVGAQYQFVENFKQQVGNKEAEIDFGNTIFGTVGMTWSF